MDTNDISTRRHPQLIVFLYYIAVNNYNNNAVLFRTPLKASAATKGYSADEKWKVIVNTAIEIDE